MPDYRLGDIIDDFCVKCKRIMNHAIVSMVNSEPAKVRCRTCHNDHDYRHEKAPPPKVDPRKAALFNEVLATVAPQEVPEESEADELELAAEATAETSVEEVEEVEAPKPTAAKAAVPKAAGPKVAVKARKTKSKASK
jgi:hypothetical protein